MRQRVYLYNVVVDNTYESKHDSIVLPTNVKKIVSICPNLVNGMGYISIFNEKTNEQLLNQVIAADDNEHWNVKNIPVLNLPEANNLYYTLRLIESDLTKECMLKVYVTYLEDLEEQ